MTTAQDWDEMLMVRLARGQRDCLERLVRRYASRLLTFIERMVGDRHASEELFQEVFLAVWLKRHQYQFPRPFKAWLYAIAVNKCRAWHRSRRSVMVTLVEDTPLVPEAPGPSPEGVLMATETAEQVSAAVTRLPGQQRAVVVLRIWEGLSYAEIAEALECTEGTVRSHMHHGLAALRRHLEPCLR
jgi:RNA polymerase sigma-70 factor (ECF subfamily)